MSTSLTELAWAYQAGKPIIILTSEKRILPSIYRENDFILIKTFDEENIKGAVEWLKEVFPHYAERKFPNFQRKN